MASRSGERARRAALGIGQARNGAEVAQALQTIRYSVLDQRKEERRSQLFVKRKDVNHLTMALQAELNRLKDAKSTLDQKIERIGPAERLEVSDHAVVRFLERVMGFDVEAIRDQIARLVPAERISDQVLYVRGGFQFLVKDQLLITVLDSHMSLEVERAFAVDDHAIAPLQPAKATEGAASEAARTLARRKASNRAKVAETTARLKAEIGA